MLAKSFVRHIGRPPQLIQRLAHRKLNLPSHLHDLDIMSAKATLNGTTIASTTTYEFVEGNVYFPASSVSNKSETLTPSSHTTWCPWKGEASYYNVNVNGEVVENGAWYYPQPLEKAQHIRDHIAFCTCR